MNNLFTLNEIKITYSHKTNPGSLPLIAGSKDVYNLIYPSWDDIDFTESFKVIFLNRANRVLGISNLSNGGTAGTVVDAKLIFQAALKSNASSIIVAHNHPSGNLKPSDADRNLTNKIKEVGKLLDLQLLDHLIISRFGYLSFADEGFM